jgi:hypothetical protein
MQGVIEGMQALNKLGIATSFFSTYDLPIPLSHSTCTELALANPNVQRLLFIEEDNYVFPDTFVALATAPYDVCTVQYNDKNGSPHGIVHYNEAGEVLWGGLGSTSVKREVFESIGAPYFRTDHMYRNTKKHMKDGKLITEYEEMEPKSEWNGDKFEEVRDEYKYGGLDIDFYTRARKNGFSVKVLDGHKGHHFELKQLGEPHTNQGLHVIRQV